MSWLSCRVVGSDERALPHSQFSNNGEPNGQKERNDMETLGPLKGVYMDDGRENGNYYIIRGCIGIVSQKRRVKRKSK